MLHDFQIKSGSTETSQIQKTKLVTLTWHGSSDAGASSEVVYLPVPYELPPQRYSSEGHLLLSGTLLHLLHFDIDLTPFVAFADVPWSWDKRYTKKDVYGQVWPRHVQLYAFQDS